MIKTNDDDKQKKAAESKPRPTELFKDAAERAFAAKPQATGGGECLKSEAKS